jgi:putative colanic acid biosynthesis acetyltransferase WcaF
VIRRRDSISQGEKSSVWHFVVAPELVSVLIGLVTNPTDTVDLSLFKNSEFSRGAPAWMEALWWLARSLFFESWFPLPSSLRVAVLRAFGAKIGKGVVIRSRVNITFPWWLEVGNHVWIGEEVLILTLDRVSIASNVCLSQRAFLCTGSHDFKKPTFDLITKPIVIEEGCWVAAGVFIGPGVTLRANTVCAAGAVVVRDAGPDVIVSGNPATIRSRH